MIQEKPLVHQTIVLGQNIANRSEDELIILIKQLKNDRKDVASIDIASLAIQARLNNIDEAIDTVVAALDAGYKETPVFDEN